MTILEAIKAGRKVQTRDKRKVRVICTDRIGRYSIVALIGEKEELSFSYDKDGHSNGINPDLDLVVIPEKKTLWFNVYRDDLHEVDSGFHLGYQAYLKKKEALENSKASNYICTKSIDIEF